GEQPSRRDESCLEGIRGRAGRREWGFDLEPVHRSGARAARGFDREPLRYRAVRRRFALCFGIGAAGTTSKDAQHAFGRAGIQYLPLGGPDAPRFGSGPATFQTQSQDPFSFGRERPVSAGMKALFSAATRKAFLEHIDRRSLLVFDFDGVL